MNVSVIIPSYNRAHTLARAIDSVLAQTYSAAQIIVVNDGSTDETVSLLTQYSQIKVISLAHKQGVSAARNIGIAQATGDWIALLDSDDTWMPEKLAHQVAAVQENPDIYIFHTDEVWIRNGKRVNAKHKHAKPTGWVYTASLELCCVSPSSILMHRSVLQACGDFDERFPACEDYDLWLRIFSRFAVKLIDKPLVVKYGGHDDQLSRQHWGMDRFRVRALSKMLDSRELGDKEHNLTVAMLQKKCRILALGARKRGKAQELAEYEATSKRYLPRAIAP